VRHATFVADMYADAQLLVNKLRRMDTDVPHKSRIYAQTPVQPAGSRVLFGHTW
ncbi:hypothetical protein GGH92_005703, partial [Coemansia sp. RSA 2673]